MKATELMIGDWVCLKDDTKCEFPLKVDGVLTDDISLEGEGFLGGVDGLIRPIPITPEILEKNGWWYDVEDMWLHDEVDFGIERRKGFQCYNISQIKLYSVHQLQQTLRLCGLDELAENFKI